MNSSSFALNTSKLLRRFPLIHSAVRRIYCIFRPGLRFRVEQAFRNFDEVFVLKIGANDGVESDPLADFLLNDGRYRGLLVEPIPQYANMLSANYEKTGRFMIEQAAIAMKDGKTTMYFVDEKATDSKGQPLPVWLRGVASLDRAHVEKHLLPEMRGAIRETTVDCLSVASLLVRNEVRKVDLLHIDAEGHDYSILQQFNFSVIRPKIVIFERKHLSKQDESAAKAIMERFGYEVKMLETDCLCIAQ
ncbi:MAG: FkbM family methyltransferase [Verrucomicrobiota bacterium]|jgi:FkbM family methyltransferase